jgi:cbb3-type cytochrome oxidase subunit 3
MKLSDVVGHSGLTIFAEIALVLFLLVFAALVWRIFSPRRRAALEAAGRMALDDGTAPRPESDLTSTLGAIA